MTLTNKPYRARGWWGAGLLALGLATALVPAAAEAQFLERGRGVAERPRPEFDPIGVPLGGFLLFPSLAVTGEYNSNIFSTDSNEVDDFIFHIQPTLDLVSQWNRHAARMFFTGDFAFFTDNSSEDYQDYSTGISGRYDIAGDATRQDTFVRGGFTFRRAHEERGSPDDLFGDEPTLYRVWSPTLGVFNRWNRVAVSVDGTVNRIDFDDIKRPRGLVGPVFGSLNNDDRDRYEYIVAAQTSYQIQPEYDAYVRFTYNNRDYDNRFDDFGFERSSDGFEIVGGVKLDLTGLLFADVFAGYRTQDYDDSRLKTIDGPTFGLGVTWNATQLTTARLNVLRTVEETTLTGSSGYFATSLQGTVDHELLRNLILSANAGYQQNDYEGISREDDIFRAGVSGRYLLNRNFYLSLGYRYEMRDSNVAGQDYDRNTVLLRLQGQL